MTDSTSTAETPKLWSDKETAARPGARQAWLIAVAAIVVLSGVAVLSGVVYWCIVANPVLLTARQAARNTLETAAQAKGATLHFKGDEQLTALHDGDSPNAPPVYVVSGSVMIESAKNPGWDTPAPYESQMMWKGYPGGWQVLLTKIGSQVVQDARSQLNRQILPQGVMD